MSSNLAEAHGPLLRMFLMHKIKYIGLQRKYILFRELSNTKNKLGCSNTCP